MHLRRPRSSARPHPGPAPGRATRALGPALAAVVLLTACGGTTSAADGTDRADDAPAAAVSPAPSSEPVDATPEPAPTSDGRETPEESFRSWLAASRVPDVDVACAYLTDALVERMVDEMTADGWPGITDCPSMTTVTAELYAAFDATAEVSVVVVDQTADLAVLDVRYAAGDCGRVVMAPQGHRWVMDERTEEQC